MKHGGDGCVHYLEYFDDFSDTHVSKLTRFYTQFIIINDSYMKFFYISTKHAKNSNQNLGNKSTIESHISQYYPIERKNTTQVL